MSYRCPRCGYKATWDAVRRCQVGHWDESPYWDPEKGELSQELYEEDWE